MGEVGNCYENALAERLNGILKCEYGLNHHFASLHHAHQAVIEAVNLYNFERPHLSLNLAKPAQIHLTVVTLEEDAPLISYQEYSTDGYYWKNFTVSCYPPLKNTL